MPEKPLTETQARALALRLREFRDRAELSQEAVALQAGISRNHYQLLERGFSDRAKGTPSNPTLSTLIALTDVLGTTIPALLADVIGPFPQGPDVEVADLHGSEA